MSGLTYSVTQVTNVYYAGFNTTGDAGGNWTMTEMTPTSTAGEYTAQVTLAGACSWGAKIYINGSWDIFFGGSDGTLYYKGDGMEKAGSRDVYAHGQLEDHDIYNEIKTNVSTNNVITNNN
jgi:hypothetical protein